MDQMFISFNGKLYPTDPSVRANVVKGHSRHCPMPMKIALTIECTRRETDWMIDKNIGEYCWNSCDIKDCPTYINNN